MAEKKKDIKFDYSNAEVVFTDVIQVNIVDDTVHLGIGLKEKDGTAIVSHKIYMTTNHFFNVAEVFYKASTDIKAQILSHSKNKKGSE